MIEWIRSKWKERSSYGVYPTKHGFQIYRRKKFWFFFYQTRYWDHAINIWRVEKDDPDTYRVNFMSVMSILTELTKYKYNKFDFIEILSRGKVI